MEYYTNIKSNDSKNFSNISEKAAQKNLCLLHDQNFLKEKIYMHRKNRLRWNILKYREGLFLGFKVLNIFTSFLTFFVFLQISYNGKLLLYARKSFSKHALKSFNNVGKAL